MLDFIFALIRNSLFGTPVPHEYVPEGIDWGQLIKAASKQTVLGLVADAIGRLDPELQPPAQVTDRLRKFVMRNMATHNLLNTTLAEIVNFYNSNGIPGVLLKGQGIAINYPNPLLRQCGDIDYYVGVRNFDRACDVAKACPKYEEEENDITSKHYAFKANGVTVEVHRRAAVVYTPWLKRRFDQILAEGLDTPENLIEKTIGSAKVLLPGADFNAFFIFFHLFHHFQLEGVGLRQLCDWAMVLHANKDTIDRDKLYRNLKKLNLLKMWQAFGLILVDHIGLTAEELPFYDPKAKKMSDKILAIIAEGGNFGFHSKNFKQSKAKNVIVHKAESFYYVLLNTGRKFAFSPSEEIFYTTFRLRYGIYKLLRPSTWQKDQTK